MSDEVAFSAPHDLAQQVAGLVEPFLELGVVRLLRLDGLEAILDLDPKGAPFAHVAELDAADKKITDELMDLTKSCQTALRAGYNPHGFNVGINLGKVFFGKVHAVMGPRMRYLVTGGSRGLGLQIAEALGEAGATLILLIYPRLKARDIVGTDIAHAVPLTLVAGLGHAALGTVNFSLLGALLLGSLPGIYIGSHISAKIPEHVLRPVLATMLLIIGAKLLLF